jgi:vanillate O-demethylase ferredoxin subunit
LCVIDVVGCTGTIDHRDVFFSKHQHDEGKKICACVSRVTGGTISVAPPFRPDIPLRSGSELTAR